MALEICQREPAGIEYSEVNESAGDRDVAAESVFGKKTSWPSETLQPIEGYLERSSRADS